MLHAINADAVMLPRTKLLAAAGILIATGVVAATIELPLAPHDAGPKVVSGAVVSCEFGRLGVGRYGKAEEFFVGMQLDNPSAPYLRGNFPNRQRDFYQDICDRKAHLTVHYNAQRLLIRPAVTYWIDEVEQHHSLQPTH